MAGNCQTGEWGLSADGWLLRGEMLGAGGIVGIPPPPAECGELFVFVNQRRQIVLAVALVRGKQSIAEKSLQDIK